LWEGNKSDDPVAPTVNYLSLDCFQRNNSQQPLVIICVILPLGTNVALVSLQKKTFDPKSGNLEFGPSIPPSPRFFVFLFPLQIPPKIRSTWSQGTSLSATLSGPNQSLGLVAMSGPPRQMESAHNLGFCPEMDGEIESCYVLIISDNYLAIISCNFYNLLGSI
jgi:hypothetical protein